MGSRSRPPRRGFTLVELLVATTLTLVLMAGLWTILRQSRWMSRVGLERSSLRQAARGMAQRLGDDLGAVASPSSRDAPQPDSERASGGSSSRLPSPSTPSPPTTNDAVGDLVQPEPAGVATPPPIVFGGADFLVIRRPSLHGLLSPAESRPPSPTDDGPPTSPAVDSRPAPADLGDLPEPSWLWREVGYRFYPPSDEGLPYADTSPRPPTAETRGAAPEADATPDSRTGLVRWETAWTPYASGAGETPASLPSSERDSTTPAARRPAQWRRLLATTPRTSPLEDALAPSAFDGPEQPDLRHSEWAPQVAAVRFRYFADGGWQSAWNRPEPPRAVEFALDLRAPQSRSVETDASPSVAAEVASGRQPEVNETITGEPWIPQYRFVFRIASVAVAGGAPLGADDSDSESPPMEDSP